MGGQAVGKLFLSLCALALVCIAISGAPRLIAGEEDAPPSASTVAAQAYLTQASQESVPQSAPRAETRVRGSAQAAQSARLGVMPLLALRRDANGNVLAAQASYLRAVYWAFALGDGFV